MSDSDQPEWVERYISEECPTCTHSPDYHDADRCVFLGEREDRTLICECDGSGHYIFKEQLQNPAAAVECVPDNWCYEVHRVMNGGPSRRWVSGTAGYHEG